ncbi:hypothetical protein TREES_T100007674 [Tupaia chinensis]|uniref:Uncharacterized protein n=1 Tax=Tupaia chinensis TaxID=246437 RepID=L9KT26_TUPCH|nr:hypothetical protein TREES_T100007674 [Tupaia chinensis]
MIAKSHKVDLDLGLPEKKRTKRRRKKMKMKKKKKEGTRKEEERRRQKVVKEPETQYSVLHSDNYFSDNFPAEKSPNPKTQILGHSEVLSGEKKPKRKSLITLAVSRDSPDYRRLPQITDQVSHPPSIGEWSLHKKAADGLQQNL